MRATRDAQGFTSPFGTAIAHRQAMSNAAIRMAKADAMRELHAAMQQSEPDVTLVMGEGPLDALLAIVGEAPGPEEERLGRPFVGPAGKMLDRLLADAGISREIVWLTNAVKRRPVALVRDRLVTRSPSHAEARGYLSWLLGELAIIGPRIVVCLGTVPARGLIHKDFRLISERGKWFRLSGGALAIATFHPAYLRRFGKRLMEIARQDFRAVRVQLELQRSRAH